MDPTRGMRTTKPTDVKPNMSAAIKPHPAPLASTQSAPDVAICEIDGSCDIQHAELFQPNTGADTHDVKRFGLAAVYVLEYFIFLRILGSMAIQKSANNGCISLPLVLSIKPISSQELETNSHNAIVRKTTILIFGLAL